MKVFSIVAALALSTPVLAAGSDLNCEVTKAGVTKKVHAKNEQTCQKRQGKWVAVQPEQAAATTTTPVTTTVQPTTTQEPAAQQPPQGTTTTAPVTAPVTK